MCKAYKKTVVIHAGIGEFDVGNLIRGACPMCYRNVRITSCGIRGNCWYRYFGESKKDGIASADWKHVDKSIYLTFENDNKIKWDQLKIFTTNKDPLTGEIVSDDEEDDDNVSIDLNQSYEEEELQMETLDAEQDTPQVNIFDENMEL
jgi:hypothetical protein